MVRIVGGWTVSARLKAKARAGLPVFQSHGRQDPVLPYVAAEWLKEVFVEAGMEPEFVPFDGGRLQVTQNAWDTNARQWFDVFDDARGVGEWGHWTGGGIALQSGVCG